MILYTVGHGVRSTDELVAVLRAAGVERLVDVRRFPGSRRNPHLSREALAADLPLAYEWWGEELGGRRSRPKDRPTRHPAWRNEAFQAYADYMDTEPFRTALQRLLAEADADHTATAVMCAETVWWRCHRRLIADAAVSQGAEVVHLLDVGTTQPHKASDGLRIDDDGWPVYDLGPQTIL